jgi:hypothetical protein
MSTSDTRHYGTDHIGWMYAEEVNDAVRLHIRAEVPSDEAAGSKLAIITAESEQA